MALSDIRAVLGEEALSSHGDWVRVNESIVRSDVSELERLVDEAKSDRQHERAVLERATDLVTGSPCTSLAGDWVAGEWFRIQEIYAGAVIRLIEVCAEDSLFQAGVEAGKRALLLLGCREDIHIALMRLYVAQGTPSLAIAQLEELERQMDDLWGEPPSPEAYAAIESTPGGGRTPLAPTEGRLIGRESLANEVTKALCESRLVTLVGTGGVGKTSLATEVAEKLGRPFAFVDLSAESERSGVARQVQIALGMGLTETGESAAAVASALAVLPKLLVLDNLEQLDESGVSWIADLMARGPEAQILTTTRASLQIPGETQILVPPLKQPEEGETLDEMRNSPAVALFEREGQRANSRFRLTPANAKAVASICRQLDGLPLAIELAAAGLSVRSPAQILAQIQDSHKGLARKAERKGKHDSLALTIEGSLGLLSPGMQEACLALSTIRGRFGIELAHAVTQSDDPARALEALVTASLLNSDPSGEETEFWMFETIRVFMQEELRARGAYDKVMTRLHDHMAQLAYQIRFERQLSMSDRHRSFHKQRENFVGALRHGVSSPVNTSATAQFVVDCIELGLSDNRTLVEELTWTVYNWPEGALPAPLRSIVGSAWASYSAYQHRPVDLLDELDRIEALAEGNLEAMVAAKSRQGSVLKGAARYEEAVACFQWVLDNVPPEDASTRAFCYHNLGTLAYCVGDYEASLPYLLQSLTESRKCDNPRGRIWILFDCGAELSHQGRWEEGEPLFEEALDLCNKINSIRLEGLTRWQLGDALLSAGRPKDALLELQKAIRQVLRADFQSGLQWLFLKTAEALAGSGHPELGTRALAWLAEARVRSARPLADYEQRDFDRIRQDLLEDLGPARFDRFWTEGSAEPWEPLKDEILALNAGS